jgi:hypothetical protein
LSFYFFNSQILIKVQIHNTSPVPLLILQAPAYQKHNFRGQIELNGELVVALLQFLLEVVPFVDEGRFANEQLVAYGAQGPYVEFLSVVLVSFKNLIWGHVGRGAADCLRSFQLSSRGGRLHLSEAKIRDFNFEGLRS